MKPRTKLQQQVYRLSEDLPDLTSAQKQWALENCLEHKAYRNKSGVFCLDCGHVWDGPQKAKKCVCPSCERKLTIETTRKKLFDQTKLVMAILSVVDGFQVVRFFEINAYHKAGEIPRFHFWEIVQQWFKPDGQLTVVARTLSYGNTGFGGDLEIRNNHSNYYSSNKYDIWADYIHPEMKLLPIYKRNGFTSKIDGCNPYFMLKTLLIDKHAETLIKCKQFSLLRKSQSSDTYTYWDSIKICIRAKYLVKDAGMWYDYLKLLRHFKKDLRNPKYVCPVNLKAEHDRLVIKKRAADNKVSDERRRKKIIEDQKFYEASKSAFFGIISKKGPIKIKVLEHVKEFMEEGDLHKHCVFTNEYYKKPDSLVLSAQYRGKPVETVEVSLKEMKVVQSRGLRNIASQYHDEILKLLKSNIHIIQKKHSELKQAVA